MPRPRTVIPDTDVNFAANLANARAALGWSCSRLAKATGIPVTALWKSECQGRRVTIGEGIAIADALGTTLDMMVRDQNDFRVVLTALRQ